MIEQWAGELVGKMHINRITQAKLANEAGVSHEYVSSILNGKRTSRFAEKKFNDALDRLIAKKEG